MFNFFKKKKQQKFELSEDQALSTICFEVNHDGTINILCDWPEFNNENAKSIDDIAKFYALGIHALNQGLFEADIIDTLKNHDQSNPYNHLFIHNVLIELINIEKAIRDNNINYKRPVISPLNVFNEET
tara:strand:- start:48 stop:434 length:387 start_codon:yes stop_codon:yes gene_type:complete